MEWLPVKLNSAADIAEIEVSGHLVNLWTTRQKSESVCGQLEKMLTQFVGNYTKVWVGLWITRENIESVCRQLDKGLSRSVDK